jgi:hypothetical protein
VQLGQSDGDIEFYADRPARRSPASQRVAHRLARILGQIVSFGAMLLGMDRKDRLIPPAGREIADGIHDAKSLDPRSPPRPLC